MIFNIVTIYAWKLILLFLVIFAAGMVAGSILSGGFYALDDDEES